VRKNKPAVLVVILAWLCLAVIVLFTDCTGSKTPPKNYREFAYVSNGGSGTVSVIDLLTLRPAKTITVGRNPTGLAANPKKNEIYAVNTDSANVSVIDAERNEVVATIGVHGRPFFISVSADGKRGYVANSASSNVSVLDLEKRAVIDTVRVGNGPGVARVSPNGKIVVVSNRSDNTVSIIDAGKLAVRATVPVCKQPEDIVILPWNDKAFISCSGSAQVAAIDLKTDHLLALLDVGQTPVNCSLPTSIRKRSRPSKPARTRSLAVF
jgi:YVTN family beta-propeller protein